MTCDMMTYDMTYQMTNDMTGAIRTLIGGLARVRGAHRAHCRLLRT